MQIHTLTLPNRGKMALAGPDGPLNALERMIAEGSFVDAIRNELVQAERAYDLDAGLGRDLALGNMVFLRGTPVLFAAVWYARKYVTCDLVCRFANRDAVGRWRLNGAEAQTGTCLDLIRQSHGGLPSAGSPYFHVVAALSAGPGKVATWTTRSHALFPPRVRALVRNVLLVLARQAPALSAAAREYVLQAVVRAERWALLVCRVCERRVISVVLDPEEGCPTGEAGPCQTACATCAAGLVACPVCAQPLIGFYACEPAVVRGYPLHAEQSFVSLPM